MPSSQINIGGMNRKVTPYSSSGMAEELINVRYMNDGLELVRAKKILDGANGSRLWEHHIGDKTILLAIYDNELQCLERNMDGGFEKVDTLSLPDLSTEISVATMGNIIVFSNREAMWNKAFRYDNGAYKEMDLTRPEKKVSLSFTDPKVCSGRIYVDKDAVDSEKAAAVLSAFNVIQDENKEYLFGDMLYGFCYKYSNGKEDWSFGWTPRLGDDYREIELRIKYDGDTTNVWEDAESRGQSKLYNLLVKGHKVKASLSGKAAPSNDAWSGARAQHAIVVAPSENTITLAEPLYLLDAPIQISDVDGSMNYTSGIYVVDKKSSTSSFFVLATQGGLPLYSDEGFVYEWIDENEAKQIFSQNGYELAFDTDSDEWKYRYVEAPSEEDQDTSVGSEELYESICVYATRGLCPIDVDAINYALLEDPVSSTKNGATVTVNLRSDIYEKGTTNEYYKFERSAPIWKILEVQADRLPLLDRAKRYDRLTDELLFLVDELPISEDGDKDLSFGGSQMTANRALDVDSGRMERFGKIISYNARLHFYDSRVRIDMRDVKDGLIGSSSELYIDYVVESSLVRQRIGSYDIPTFSIGGLFIIPSAAARAAHVIYTSNGKTMRRTYRMTSSKRYNFSYYPLSNMPAGVEDNSFDTDNVVEGDYLIYDEKQAVNVTSHYNPIHFPVENSYLFGGEVLHVIPSIMSVSSVQTGNSPLAVFTNKGVFALMQGGGDVLYGNITNLSSLVLDGGVVSTPLGLVFPASGAIHLLAGTESVNISSALVGSPDRGIEGEAFTALADNAELYEIAPYVSDIDFVDFARGAALCFDDLNDEVIISDAYAYHPYSYVVNLNTKQWHKIMGSLRPTTSNCRYVTDENMQVVDLASERTDDYIRTIHIETRPVRLANNHSHIHRAILYCTALIGDSSNLSLSIFASDDLHKWKCIISSTKAVKDRQAYISQIRTNRAAKSWKYYRIVIGGKVHSDTDLSHLVIDFVPMFRRNG